MEREVRYEINGKRSLIRDVVDCYRKYGKGDYWTYTHLSDAARVHAKEFGESGLFGFSVSNKDPDRCFCFKSEEYDDGQIVVSYIGIGKC